VATAGSVNVDGRGSSAVRDKPLARRIAQSVTRYNVVDLARRRSPIDGRQLTGNIGQHVTLHIDLYGCLGPRAPRGDAGPVAPWLAGHAVWTAGAFATGPIEDHLGSTVEQADDGLPGFPCVTGCGSDWRIR
jgi:hypothetical protein